MTQSKDQQSTSSNGTGAPSGINFGANEWLVEEMKSRFDADPSSVDPAWASYFKSSGNGTPAPAAAAAAPAAQQATPTGSIPIPKASSRAEVSPAAKTMPTKPTAESKPTPKDAPKPAPVPVNDEATVTVLRGIPAATAKNMDISLSVPTATSVRNIPVKLLWDNRIVINSHLKRARGGKVSFTHLIGYAIVRAIGSMPEMNNTYAEIDGKPSMVTPPHVNLGLAIDQQKPDGTRQLVAPSIKACESMDFAQFW
ncbi:MAG TPA: 2-oxo acid dehydrogenase subunit E2, partial [Nocardioides sp.]|nr:2-oxo acid dehydrogenase subunit E2 [Nocardioides sp.]